MRRPLLLLMGFLVIQWNAMAQQTVQGTVYDENGEPLTGASIIETGTTNGTITSIDGKYALTLQNENTSLDFSFIGYITQTIPVGNRSVLDVNMELDTDVLEEVVISAIGLEQDRDKLGSTYSPVKTDDIRTSGEPQLVNSLAAKASNVQISATNGDPGAGTTIRIRGANTILGSSEPLIILDGIPISNATTYGEDIGGNEITGGRSGGVSQQSRLNDINPNDIESIQILKGASAAALWGSRAANGVIVIQTKSGKDSRLSVSFKSTYSFDQVHERIPMQTTWGQGRNGVFSPTRAESWGDYIPDRSGTADELDLTGEFFEARDGNVYYPIVNKNSQDIFVDSNWESSFQTGSMWQNDLTITGGNRNANFFFSYGRIDQEGIIRNSDYTRDNLRFNTKITFNDWFGMSAKAGYTGTSSNRIQQNSNVTGLLLGLLRTPPDFDQRDYIGTYVDGDGLRFENRHRAYRNYLGSNSNPIYNNPLWTQFEQSATSDVDRFIMSAEMDITPTPWLEFILRGGIDNFNDKRIYFFPVGSASDRNGGWYTEDIIRENQLNFDAIGKVQLKFGPDVGFVGTIGWNINDRRRSFNSSSIVPFLANARKPTSQLNAANEASSFENRQTNIRSNRGYGVFAFDFWDQLFVNFSGGLEAASSVKGTFFYPAIDGAWQFTQFWDINERVLSFGKLRASWGQVGVQPLPHRFDIVTETPFTYSTYSDPLEVALFGGGYRFDDDLGNPDLEPEIKTEWEIGLDLRFIRDKLSLNMTYYQNRIKGILLDLPLAPSFGFDTQYANAGEMQNSGFEFDFDYSILRKNNWNVGIYGNWGRNINEVTDLSGAESIDLTPGASVSSRAIVGEPLGALFGTGSQTEENGNFILNDDGFPILTQRPEVLGDPNPSWRAGIGGRAAWKGFSLKVLVEHTQGGAFSPRTLWVLRRFGTTQETANRLTTSQDLTNYAGNVVPAGTTVRGNVANFGGGPVLLDESWYRTGIGGGFGDNQAYNFSIVDATLTRLREISLFYTFNGQNFRDKTKLAGITVGVTGRNLFLWTDVVGIDPQVNQFGVSNGFGLDYFTNPSTRSFLFSVEITY